MEQQIKHLESLLKAGPSRLQTNSKAMRGIIKSLKHLAYAAKQAGFCQERRAELVRIFAEEMGA